MSITLILPLILILFVDTNLNENFSLFLFLSLLAVLLFVLLNYKHSKLLVLFGLFLNKLGKVKNELYYKTFLYFVKYLDNWMTCDTFVCNTQFKKNEYDKLLSIITYILQQQPMENISERRIIRS